MNIRESLDIYLEMIEDTRHPAYVRYKMTDIVFILVIGMLCSCTDLEMIIEFVEEKIEFIKKYTELQTIPCVETFSNILKIIKPRDLELCLYGIFNNALKRKLEVKDNQICIDGKTICSTVNTNENKRPMHIVTALLAEESVTLGQIVVDSKSNEIPAVRELIELINIENAVVTMDAMHCQKETAELIIKNGGDYVLQLKANQGKFYEDVYTMFDDKYMDIADKDSEYETYRTLEKGHGRIEKRTCYVLNEVEFFTDYISEWKGLKKIFAVKREVEICGHKTTEISCYLSSKNTTAKELLGYTRKHWEIESFHWLLDVHYNEDGSKIKNENTQICLNIIRKYCISIIKKYIKDNDVKRKTIIANMRKCLLNEEFLLDVLTYYCSSL